jgi:hypothetical protein
MAVTLPFCEHCEAVNVEGWAVKTVWGLRFICHGCADAWAYADAHDSLPARESAPDAEADCF